jgi:putative heme iron utilization protein
MSETITTTISDRICKHMNQDHGDALVLYAKFFGKLSNVESAKMLSIDHQAMYLAIDNQNKEPLKIEFDHQLENAQDAHHTLVAMMKQAQESS